MKKSLLFTVIFILVSLILGFVFVEFVLIDLIELDRIFEYGIYIDNTSTEEIKDFLTSKQLDTNTPIDVYKIYFSDSFRESYYVVWFTVNNEETEQFFSEISQAYSAVEYDPPMYPNVVGEYDLTQLKYYQNQDSDVWLVEYCENDTQTNFLLISDRYDRWLREYSKKQIKKGNWRQ